jgi:hypothetical protein
MTERQPDTDPVEVFAFERDGVSGSAEYNASLLTPAQIEFLHANLLSDLDALAAMDAEPEPEMEIEL